MSELPHGFELGPLEAEVMRLIWEMGETGVDEVHRVLQRSRPIAYTTVMTVMSRLAQRGLLERRKEGRAFFYQATVPRDDLAGATLREWVQRFFGGRPLAAVSFLLGDEKLSAEDEAAVRRLVERLSAEGEKRS